MGQQSVGVPSGSPHSSDCRGHAFVFNPRRERMKGKTGESLGRFYCGALDEL